MKEISVFERTEKKYRLDTQRYERVLATLLGRMRIDGYGLSTVCSLYYDDESDRMIRASLQRPVYKEKLRLRSYGVPTDGSEVFVELKKKLNGVVYKRRAAMPLAQARAFLNDGAPPDRESQIVREIDWVRTFYKPTPKVFIASDRIALESDEAPTLRVTFDSRIRARGYDLDLSLGDGGEPIISPDEYIMEIKTHGAMPLWLCSLLGENRVYPTSFSKYGTFYTNRMLKEKTESCLNPSIATTPTALSR